MRKLSYKEIRKKGLCTKCGKENPTPEKSMCPDCAARCYALRKQNKEYRAKIGMCVNCGKSKAEPHKKLCYECLCKSQDSDKKRDRSDYLKHYSKIRRQSRIESGMCPTCGKHKTQDGKLCEWCKSYLKRYRDKNRCDLSRSERPNYGICYICGKNPIMKDKKVCESCYEVRLKTLPAMFSNVNNENFKTLNNQVWKGLKK